MIELKCKKCSNLDAESGKCRFYGAASIRSYRACQFDSFAYFSEKIDTSAAAEGELSMRNKIKELLMQKGFGVEGATIAADHLIANGVTFAAESEEHHE